MSAVLFAAFKMTFGVFVNKARSTLSEHLRDGDVNSQKLRDLILSNMEDMKTRIDGLARCELLSSASLIKEGLFFLNDIVDKPNKFQRVSQTVADVSVGVAGLAVAGCAASFYSFDQFHDDFVDGIFRVKSWLTKSDDKEAKTTNDNPDYFSFDMRSTRKLVEAVSELKMSSPDHFKFAMECFNNAYTRATDVFFNESLTLQDRVMAAKLRVQSRLLLSLENPSLANVCKEVYLNELHDLPAIKECFRCCLDGGMLSKFNKAERHEIVLSVSLINFVLFRFLNRFSDELVNVYDWPQIEDGDWMYHPLIPVETIFVDLQQAEVEVPALMSLKPLQSEIFGSDAKLVAINTHWDLILFRQRTNPEACELLKISGGKVSVFYTFPEFTLVSFLAIDGNDGVYAFADARSNAPPGYVMYDVFMFDPRGKLRKVYKQFLLLDGSIVLAPTPERRGVALCIPDEIINREKYPPEKEIGAQNDILAENKIQGVVFNQSEEKSAEERNNRNKENIPTAGGSPVEENADFPNPELIQMEEEVLNSILLHIKMWKSTLATITDGYQVVAIEQSGYKVRVFERDGRLAREFELCGGEGEACLGVTFNSLTKELVVVSRLESGYFLSAYKLWTGERRHYVKLSRIGEECKEIHITSHRCGSMALITKEHVLYIQ